MLSKKQLAKTVMTNDGHLLWRGGLANGYPAIKRGNRTLYLKRVIWEDTYGPIPPGAVVISVCGLRPCIEPGHLALSTPGRYTSVRDALGRYAAGRASKRPHDATAAPSE